MKDFCHLHVHNEQSSLDGLGTSKQYVKRAKELGMKHIALTNHGCIDGLIDFQKACEKEGIHPVMGCLVKGQPIICSTGVRSVEKIQKGDFVFTHKGRFKPVTRIMQRNYEGMFYEIELAGMNEKTLTITEEHPVLVRNRKGRLQWLKPFEISFGRFNSVGGANCWKSWVCFPKIKTENEKKTIKINLLNYLPKGFYNNCGKISKLKQKNHDRDIYWEIPSELILDEELAYFLGLFIGDGSTNFKGEAAICSNLTFGIHKLLIARWVIGFLQKRFGIVTKEVFRKEKNTVELNFSCRPINEWLYRYCGRGAKNKHVPFDIFSCSKQIRQKMIQGLIDTDGKNPYTKNGKKQQITFKVSSKKLAWQFKTLIASLGFWSNVNKVKQNYKGRTFVGYSVNYSPHRKYSRTLEDENFVYYPIKKISSFKDSAKVYNFEVKDDNSYVSDFVLHNCEMYIVPDMRVKQDGEKRGHVVLLIKNESGWKTICRMLTKANLEGFYYKPRIDFQMLLEEDISGLIILTACFSSFVHLPGGEDCLLRLQKKTDVYLEIHPNNLPEFREHYLKIKTLHKKYNIPLVATNDTHYILKEDGEVQEVLLAIQMREKWSKEKEEEAKGRTIFFASRKEMFSMFRKQKIFTWAEIVIFLNNSLKIAEQCKFRLEKQEIHLPKAYRDVENDFEYLKGLCNDQMVSMGFIERLWYVKRLNFELNLIQEKNFSRYFLIVRDLVSWCKKNNILVGCGRGSVTGSLVAYLLGITTVDPIKYKLLFSRFINKDRIDLPDIDLDFEDVRRGDVRKYMENKYGKDNVFGISTFIKMKGKAVIRDVARVFDVPLHEVNSFTKNMEMNPEADSNVVEAFETSEGKSFDKKYPQIKKFALKLENQQKSIGVHPAGLIISPKPVIELSRGNICYRKGMMVINWGMSDTEYMGLIKLDLLGLNTLTILNETAKTVLENHGEEIEFEKIEPDDKDIYKEISKGNTVGIFQLSTWAMTELVKRMGIDCFNDLVASLALVRPGPMESGTTDEYIRRKHGGVWDKRHPLKEEILKDTYGNCIYQEQVMQMIHQMAGLPYSVADEIRKVIGKKRHSSEFEPYKKKFIDGCLEQRTFNEKEGNEFWEGLLKWSQYGFSKNHSTGYAMLAWWTAYCKFKYPLEFLCACLTYGGEAHKESYIKEAKRLNLEVIPPKLKISDTHKWVIKKEKLYIPFMEVKGIGEKTIGRLNEFAGKKRYGFFVKEQDAFDDSKLGKILRAIEADKEDSIPPDIGKYLSFNFWDKDNFIIKPEIKPFQNYIGEHKNLMKCDACALINECTRPVPPSRGKYNIMIIGEAPGFNEDNEREGFVGRSGQLLWNTLKKFKYTRQDFHISNCVKCFPSESKTPDKEQIATCSNLYLKQEIEQLDCKYALTFGNTGLFAFKGQEGGIMKMNGQIEYSQKFKLNVCYVVHPALILRDSDKLPMFEEGIRNFVNVIRR